MRPLASLVATIFISGAALAAELPAEVAKLVKSRDYVAAAKAAASAKVDGETRAAIDALSSAKGWVVKGAAAGKRRPVTVVMMGQKMRGRLTAADDESYTVKASGMTQKIKWSETDDDRFYFIVAKYADDNKGADHLALARIAIYLGVADQAEKELALALRQDPALSAEAKAVRDALGSAPPAGGGGTTARRPRPAGPGGGTASDVTTASGGKVSFGNLKVKLTVGEYGNAKRVGAPVSGGIPFARGKLKVADLGRMVLADRSGNFVASLQKPVPLVRWPDGSVKWLLVDFLADVPAGGKAEFTLGLGARAGGKAPVIRISDGGGGYTVDTGVLKAVINKSRFTFIEKAWVDADSNGSYGSDELVVSGPGEMFIDLDAAPPGPADSGASNYPNRWYFGMEGGNWLRESKTDKTVRYAASKSEYKITPFRIGATHAVFKLEGWHSNGAGRKFGKYSIFLHFYAGSSHVRASHTWIMTGDPNKNFIRRMAIELPFAGKGDSYSYAFGGPYEKPGTPITLNRNQPPYRPIVKGPSEAITGSVSRSGSAAIVSIGPDKYYHNVPDTQDLRVEYTVYKDGKPAKKGYSPSGWGDISDGTVGLAMGVRDFWREHPKEIKYRDGKMAVYMWPDHGGKTLDLRRRYPEVRGAGPKRGGSFGRRARRVFGRPGSSVGVAKTTELFFQFHGGKHNRGKVDTTFRSFQDPLMPFAGGEYNCATGVMASLHPYDMKNFPRTENYIDLTYAWPIRSQQEYSWYGWLDYGDHLIEYESLNWELDVRPNNGLYANWGYSGWVQEGYRYGQWMFAQYMRSGRYEYFREADTWLRHHRDVDCVWWDKPDDGPRPNDNKGANRLGGGHRHDQQHWGTYMTGYGIPLMATTHHYVLTGDGRDLDTLPKNIDWILHHCRDENRSHYAAAYAATLLGDDKLMQQCLSSNLAAGNSYGRNLYCSGMGLMLLDAHTGGAPAIRSKLKAYANMNDVEACYIQGYLAKNGEASYASRAKSNWNKIFPAKRVRSQYFGWAARRPANFRDAFSPDIVTVPVMKWPLRMIEKVQFDAPNGMGNNPSRNSYCAQLMWVMDMMGQEPK